LVHLQAFNRSADSIAKPACGLREELRRLLGLTDFLMYQRDGEIIAFARPDLAVAGTGLSAAAPVVDIRAMSAA
jgi:hypothetical protein